MFIHPDYKPAFPALCQIPLCTIGISNHYVQKNISFVFLYSKFVFMALVSFQSPKHENLGTTLISGYCWGFVFYCQSFPPLYPCTLLYMHHDTILAITTILVLHYFVSVLIFVLLSLLLILLYVIKAELFLKEFLNLLKAELSNNVTTILFYVNF